MSTEIERIPKVKQPTPEEVLQGVATMQAFTVGFLVISQMVMGRRLAKLNRALGIQRHHMVVEHVIVKAPEQG
jgi:hypothetical protein